MALVQRHVIASHHVAGIMLKGMPMQTEIVFVIEWRKSKWQEVKNVVKIVK